MRKWIFSLGLTLLTFAQLPPAAHAAAGDYSLRALSGVSFKLSDYQDQFKMGGEFDYDIGYKMGVQLLVLGGFASTYRFQLMPSFRYNVIYIGPGAVYAAAGAGLSRFSNANGFDLRMAAGLALPLGKHLEAVTHVNYFLTALGTPGTPQTFDWLLGLGFKF